MFGPAILESIIKHTCTRHFWANTYYPTIPGQQRRVSEGMGLYLSSFLRGIRCILSPGLQDLHGCHSQPAAWTEWHGPTEIDPNLIRSQSAGCPSFLRVQKESHRWRQVRIHAYFYCICIFPAKVLGDVISSAFLTFSSSFFEILQKRAGGCIEYLFFFSFVWHNILSLFTVVLSKLV